MSYKPFKMKGHTLPGINQREADRTADGRPGSSALQKKEGYNPDGSVDKNSERYKKAMEATKKSDAMKAKENELRNTIKTGNDVEAKRARTELMSKGSISMDEKRRRDAENKKKEGGGSAVKLLGRKKNKMNASKTVKLKERNMSPGDAVFEGSEKSKVNQRITNNVYTKKDGKMATGTKTSKTHTHYPEGHGSTKTEKAGKRTRVTEADGSTKVIKKRTLGGTKEFAYDAQGNLKTKVKRNRKGNITNAKGDNVFSNKKLRNKGRKTKDFSKKEKAALANAKTKYTG